MFYGISRLTFETESITQADSKMLGSLVESLRGRFKVSVKRIEEHGKNGELGIVIAVLAHNPQEINRQLDKISEYCENFGLGRIMSEQTIVDLIDSDESDL
jgi:uncharacterized protein YlxP (DUF503 family)